MPLSLSNRKGLSTIIATVMVILITVIAGAIIAQFVIPYVSQNLEKGGECLSYGQYYIFDEQFGYNCYANGKATLSVRAQNDPELTKKIDGFSVILSFGRTQSSQIIKVQQSTGGIAPRGSSQPAIPGSGNTLTYDLNYDLLKGDPDRAEIYPILNSGRTCQKSSAKISLKPCT